MPLRRSASILSTRRPIIGNPFITARPSMKRRGRTRARAIRVGFRALNSRVVTLLTMLGAVAVVLSTIGAKSTTRDVWIASALSVLISG
jgi:hypothetical protein